jgi:hypothetical protein
MSDHRVGDSGSIPGRGKGFFSSFCVQTSSGQTQPPIQWVPRVLSLGVKHAWDVTLTTHPHLVPRSRMKELYFLSPLASAWLYRDSFMSCKYITYYFLQTHYSQLSTSHSHTLYPGPHHLQGPKYNVGYFN